MDLTILGISYKWSHIEYDPLSGISPDLNLLSYQSGGVEINEAQFSAPLQEPRELLATEPSLPSCFSLMLCFALLFF